MGNNIAKMYQRAQGNTVKKYTTEAQMEIERLEENEREGLFIL